MHCRMRRARGPAGAGAAHDCEERDGRTASSCIRRDGELPGGSPTCTGARMRLRGLAFQAVEHARGSGEEVVMVAEKVSDIKRDEG
ncbi:hypothetical protein [Methanothrix sp.]|uniref:hypothetical protein n=1 Tax=Methanothrix sp. TaxID=90426 RepID=UPI0034E20D3E